MKRRILITLFSLVGILCLSLIVACQVKTKFKLSFIVDDTVYATLDTSGGEAISMPQNPTKDDYVFDGWYWDEDVWQRPFTVNSLLDEPLNSDMSVYAKWKKNNEEDSDETSDPQKPDNNTADDGSKEEETSHTHQYSAEWSSDEVNHWHAATCGHTDIKDKAAHTYVNGVCSTCNHAHENHSYGSYTADDSNHTHTCTVCQKSVSTTHTYVNGVCSTCNHAHVNHVYGNWIEDTPASETATGSHHKDCFCGNRVTEETPKIVAFEFRQSGNGYAVTAYTGSLTELTVPSEHEGKPVTIIDDYAFYDGAFTSIKLPTSLKEIGRSAFGYCTKLNNIQIPNCARIGDSAFEGCAALQEITLPEDAIFLGSALFKYCSALKNVTIKGGAVQSTTFSGAEAVEQIVLGEGVNSIAQSAFESCKNLQELTMPRVDTTNSFMRYYFNTTAQNFLKSLIITNQQISIYNKVFEDCKCKIEIWVKFPVAKISVIGASEYYIDNFAEENYKLRVEYEDGFKEDFPLFGYISQEDQAAFRIAGSHEITATYQNKTCTATIDVLLHQFDEAVLENAEYVFDGSPHSLAVTGAPEGTDIVYTGNEQSEVGEHTVTAYLTNRYYEPKTLTATLNILKPYFDINYVLGLDCVTNSNPANYATDGQNVTLQNPARPGWEFVGWYTEASFSHKITEIKGDARIDYTLYAKWKTVFTLSGGTITGLTTYGKEQTELIIDETINGTKITSIGDKAFYQNAKLQKITLPASITSIGRSAFMYCTNHIRVYITDLTAWCNIEFGDSGANPLYYADHPLGNNLYLNDKLVTEITADMLQGVTKIKDYAFEGCSSLTSITIPDSVTSIGGSAFMYCTRLESVNLGDNSKLTSIGDYAFYDCCFTSITISKSVTSIGYRAFRDCESLTGVYITDIKAWCSIEFGDEYANPLYYAHNLYLNNEPVTKITAEMLQGVTKIKDYAFYGCTSIKSIEIPDSVTSIGKEAFYCKSLTGVYITDLKAWCNIEFGGDYANPLYYAHNLYLNDEPVTDITADMLQGVTEIKAYTFAGFGGTSLTIPNSVTSIGRSAFSGCVAEIKWGDKPSIQKIGGYAFSGYKGTSITIPDGVTSIGNYAFYKCTSLTSITIPDSVTSIGDYAFSECRSLESITIPASVTSIGNYAFSECTSLESVTIGNGVTSIGYRAFYSCTSLESVTIGNGVTSIGYRAFYSCTSLESITIPNSVTSIGDLAFSSCTSLETVYWNATNCIRAGSYELNYNYTIFKGCTALTTVHIGENVKSIPDYAFYERTSLASVNFGNNSKLETIGSHAFYSCTSLENITIPASVTSIGSYAFWWCTSLESITIPAGVTSIGSRAFANCTNLATVYYGGNKTQWNSITIVGSDNYKLQNATRYYFSETAPDEAKWAESENWWHYDPVTGEIAIWKKD